MAHLVVFTDLDGTLLERKTYSAAKSRKAINELKKMGIPLIFCSSKTKRFTGKDSEIGPHSLPKMEAQSTSQKIISISDSIIRERTENTRL